MRYCSTSNSLKIFRKNNSIDVFPNPTHEKIFVGIEAKIEKVELISFFDIAMFKLSKATSSTYLIPNEVNSGICILKITIH